MSESDHSPQTEDKVSEIKDKSKKIFQNEALKLKKKKKEGKGWGGMKITV